MVMDSMHRHTKKVLLISFWIFVVCIAAYFWLQSGISLQDIPNYLQQQLLRIGIIQGALLYLCVHLLRPFLFFPATLLTLSGAVIFGPWLGFVLTFIGDMASSFIAFTVARFLGREWVQRHEGKMLKGLDKQLSSNGIITVMILRFIYVPFDVVNYSCGLSSMSKKAFLIGTCIGILPGLLTFSFLGGSISAGVSGMQTVLGMQISERILLLLLSVFFFLIGFVVATLLRKTGTAKSIGAK